MELGTAGLMRGYMAHPCDEKFSLEKKLYHFLSASLSVYKVPEEEQEQVLDFIARLNIRQLAWQVMQVLFQELAMHFEFSLSGILPEAEDGKIAAEKAEATTGVKTEVGAKTGVKIEAKTKAGAKAEVKTEAKTEAGAKIEAKAETGANAEGSVSC